MATLSQETIEAYREAAEASTSASGDLSVQPAVQDLIQCLLAELHEAGLDLRPIHDVDAGVDADDPAPLTISAERHYNVRQHQTWVGEVPADFPTWDESVQDQYICDNLELVHEDYDVLEDDDRTTHWGPA